MQGQSDYTSFKEYRFAPVLAQSLRISKAPTVAGYPYYHVDLNSGGGYNTDVQVPGSPLNFLNAVERNGRSNFYAFFVDHEWAAIEELTKRPEVEARPDRISIFYADNREILSVVDAFMARRERRPEYAMGTILIDPNGYHKGVPWEALRLFCLAHPRMDVLMNLNVRTYWLERSHILNGEWDQHRLRPVSEFPTWFHRPHWMLTDITRIKGNSWVQLVGRTIRTTNASYASLGFYDIKSDRGRAIVAEIERTNPGGAAQFSLL